MFLVSKSDGGVLGEKNRGLLSLGDNWVVLKLGLLDDIRLTDLNEKNKLAGILWM